MPKKVNIQVPRPCGTASAMAAGLLLLALARPAGAELRKVTDTFDDGSPRAVYAVDAGERRQGTCLQYHRGGRVRIRSTYVDGQLHGNLIHFGEDGRKQEVALYRRDQLSGPRQIFEQGVRVREELWLEGIRIADRSKTQITQAIARIERTPVTGATPVVAAALRRLMVYRYLCRVPHEGMSIDKNMSEHAAAAARICAHYRQINHQPPNPGWPEADYRRAFLGARSSNLAFGTRDLARTIDGYMADSGPSNIGHLGHRRWCLNPPMLKTGFGESDDFSAMWCLDRSRRDLPEWDHIAYPPAGFVPRRLFGSSHAWSVMLSPTRYRPPETRQLKIIVRAIGPGTLDLEKIRRLPPMDLEVAEVSIKPYGIRSCLIFRPEGGVAVTPGRRYWVEIDGLEKLDGGAGRIEYYVEFM